MEHLPFVLLLPPLLVSNETPKRLCRLWSSYHYVQCPGRAHSNYAKKNPAKEVVRGGLTGREKAPDG